MGRPLLCPQCDVEQHPFAHWHERSSLAAGYKKPLPASTQFTATGEEVSVQKFCASMQPCACGAEAWDFSQAASSRSIAVISLLGAYGRCVRAGSVAAAASCHVWLVAS
jgi:hypothetical protein